MSTCTATWTISGPHAGCSEWAPPDEVTCGAPAVVSLLLAPSTCEIAMSDGLTPDTRTTLTLCATCAALFDEDQTAAGVSPDYLERVVERTALPA